MLQVIDGGPAQLDKWTDAVNRQGSAAEAAKKQQETLRHQIDVLGAAATDYGTDLGEFLIPKITDLEHATADTIQWFDKNHDAAYALAAVVGGALTASVATFTVNTAVGMVGSVKSALVSLGAMEGETDSVAASTTAAAAATQTATASTTAATAAITNLTAQLETLNATLGGNVAADTRAAAGMQELGDSAEVAGGKMSVAGEAAGEAGMAGGLTEAGEAVGGLALGPVTFAVIGLGAAAYGLNKVLGNTPPAFEAADTAAENMASSTIPELTLKIAALNSQQNILIDALKKGGTAGFDAALQLGKVHDAAVTAAAAQTEMSNNLTILSSGLNISKNNAQSLAQELGVNLGGALTKADVQAFSQQIQQSGLDMDTAGSKATNMGANTVAAMSKIGTQIQTSLNSTEWQQLGSDIDGGVAAGITANAAGMKTAMTNAMNGTLAAARDTVQAHSPSRLFAEQVGWPIAQGVAVGITEKAGMVNAATSQMLSGAVPGVGGITPQYAPSGVGGGSSSYGGQTAQVSVTLELGGVQFMQALQTAQLQYQRVAGPVLTPNTTAG